MNIDRLFSVFKTAGSGMAAQRRQIMVSSENIANANTTRVEGRDGPYKPKKLIQTQRNNGGAFHTEFQRTRLNLANSRTEHMDNAEHSPTAEASQNRGPEISVTEQDKFRYEYDPQHPDADENGMVKYPDLDLVEEMTRMTSANRLYESNLAVVEAEKQVIRQALQL